MLTKHPITCQVFQTLKSLEAKESELLGPTALPHVLDADPSKPVTNDWKPRPGWRGKREGEISGGGTQGQI